MDSPPSKNVAQQPSLADRFSLGWPICWAVVGFFGALGFVGASVLRAFYQAGEILFFIFVFAGFLFLSTSFITLFWLAYIIFCVWDAAWRSLLSALIAPICAILLPYAYLKSGISPRFLIERPRMEHAVFQMSEKVGARYMEFPWEQTGFAGGGNTEETMVYDETDAIPSAIESGATRWPANRTVVSTMGRHFYLVNESLDQ